MATIELEKKIVTEAEVAKLWEAFKVFDADGSSTISIEELEQVMRSLGQSSDEAVLRDMIKEVDIDSSGSIDFEEFRLYRLSYAKVIARCQQIKQRN